MPARSDGDAVEEKRLVVGLGNPGFRYEKTRHNAGFMVLDGLARDLGLSFKAFGLLGLICEGRLDGAPFCLLKPLTFMNRCGRAVGDLKDRFEIPLTGLFVVSDDFHLPLGKIRIRRKGSDGGHRGLKSIIRTLGDGAFPRLRIGIGPVPGDRDTVEYVLEDFEAVEGEKLKDALHRANEALRLWLTTGDLDRCMNRFNREPA